MTEQSVIVEIRLDAFKSFHDAVLPLADLTLVVGRNGSGKSNALDGLWALARLAQGDDIRGGRDGPAVRGGAAGCAPLGEATFALGLTVATGSDRVRLRVEVQVEPEVQVVGEELWSGREQLYDDAATDLSSADIDLRWGATRRKERFRASRLLATQVLARIPAMTEGRRIHLAAAQVLAALRSVFVLDPVPATMRQDVPRRDDLLRRDADNLSAAVGTLLEDPATASVLAKALSSLNEQQVRDVTVSASSLDDVMLTLVERWGGADHQVPAQMMSDGTLRFLAILVALLQSPSVEAVPAALASEDADGQTTVVVEELENGLHASQAGLLVGLIRDEVHHRRIRALATPHSPALLDALSAEEHRGVVVCRQRDAEGRSTLGRLVDLPNYVDIAAGGGLGRAAENDRLRLAERPGIAPSAALAAILEGDQR